MSRGYRPPGTRPPVGPSADLNRILALPRRELETAYPPENCEALERALKHEGRCVCDAQGRRCPTSLKPIQAWALLEAQRAGGLLAPIGAGYGKTLLDLLLPMVVPDCKTAVLLVQASLVNQLLEHDVPYYGGHWKLPNIVGGGWFVAGRPALHIVTYHKLQQTDSSGLLKRIAPDLIIADECHNLKSAKGPRVSRFKGYLDEHPGTRVALMSGTIGPRSIKDYAHLARLALGEGSPLPLLWGTVEEWSTALDPFVSGKGAADGVDYLADPGALLRLCDPGEPVRSGFRRRRNATLGVVASSEVPTDVPLTIRRRTPPPISATLLEHIDVARRGKRPDGEVFRDKLAIAECVRQLACGFYHFWRYPWTAADEQGDDARSDLIDDWFRCRQEFNRELRDKLERPQEHLDSPALLIRAAERYHAKYDGPLHTWASYAWPEWAAIKDKVEHVTATEWVDDWLVRDAAAWALESPGIVWVEYPVLGERIAKAAGLPWYGGGPLASVEIKRETGARSIVASSNAHDTGKNLQQFRRNLVVTPPTQWEQLLARTHRDGQRAPRVEVDVYLHTDDFERTFEKALEYAKFNQEADGPKQRLLLAEIHT